MDSGLRFRHLPALVLAASLLTSCSYFTSFVLVNHAPGPVTVTWTFVPPQGGLGSVYCPLTERGFEAATGGIVRSRLWGDRFERRGVAAGFSVDAEACRAIATVEPGTTLCLHQETNFVATNSMDRAMLDRLRIEVQGPSGTATVEPGQALQGMTRSGDMLYALAYR